MLHRCTHWLHSLGSCFCKDFNTDTDRSHETGELQQLTIMCVTSVFHSAEASVHTEIQAGPLYRVAGSPLSISCNVSGFSSESAIKPFEFRVAKPANPTLDLNIISTTNPHFGYGSHQSRVRIKDITLTHVNPNSVLFEIKKLLKDDEGTYECFVTNLEGFNGVYNGKTTVKGNPSPSYFYLYSHTERYHDISCS